MAHLNRKAAQRLMQAEGMDALLILSAEGFAHATGAAPGVATMWRREGAVAVLVPADPDQPETVVISDLFAANLRRDSRIRDIRESPIWVEAMTITAPDLDGDLSVLGDLWDGPGRPVGNRRPETFDPAITYGHLRDALAEKGLRTGRVGVELSAVAANGIDALTAALAPTTLTDGTRVARQLRAMKSPEEIALLRSAVEVAEVGISAVRDAISVGVARSDLAAVWSATVAKAGAGRPMTGQWEYISVGADPWGGDAIAAPGDLVKVDVGCLMRGYTSDSGRTFVVGQPRRLQAEMHAALMTGFRAGFDLLHPGTPLSEVHRATQSAIRGRGLGGYSRGHFGHSLGTGPGSEEWPFISADADTRIESGMVLAFETPIYVTGVGGMIIEDQVEITDNGPVSMNRLTHDLVAC